MMTKKEPPRHKPALSYGGCTQADLDASIVEFSPQTTDLSIALRVIDARLRNLTRRVEQIEGAESDG